MPDSQALQGVALPSLWQQVSREIKTHWFASNRLGAPLTTSQEFKVTDINTM